MIGARAKRHAPPIADLRHGVTEVEHQVLDLVDELEKGIDAAHELEMAFGRIKQARRTTSDGTAAVHAQEAAARLIRFAHSKADYLAQLRKPK